MHPVLSDLQVLLSSNTAGIYVDNCSPVIMRSTIAGNDGPGISTSPSVINVDASINNTITENSNLLSYVPSHACSWALLWLSKKKFFNSITEYSMCYAHHRDKLPSQEGQMDAFVIIHSISVLSAMEKPTRVWHLSVPFLLPRAIICKVISFRQTGTYLALIN